jgi:hypothetical protein
MQFNQTGGTGGQINLTATIRISGQPPVTQSAVINYNATISEFLGALNRLACFSPYQISGNRSLFDINGNLTTNIAEAFTYSYTISIAIARRSSDISTRITPLYINNYTGNRNFTFAILRPHGPLISGTFALTLNGVSILFNGSPNIPAVISTDNLRRAINAVTGFGNTQVDLITDSNFQAYGAIWVFTFYGVNGLIPPMLVDDLNLLGGVMGTKPSMTASILRNYSSNLLFDPIDFNFLSTDSAQINVRVTVN